MTTWTPTAPDRDEAGNIRTDVPRKLADLLPATEEAPAAPQQPLSASQAALLGGALLILAAALVALLAQPGATPAAQPTAAVSTPAPAPSALPTIAPRQVTAYAAPGGVALGPIPAGAAPVARYGDGWVQVPHDGGAVWIAAEGDVDLALPDLAPRPTTAPAPIGAAQPPPTMEPEVCIRTDYGQRCGPASQMADEEQAVADEIATESKARSDAWLATATAEAQLATATAEARLATATAEARR